MAYGTAASFSWLGPGCRRIDRLVRQLKSVGRLPEEVRMLLPVHDSVLLEARESCVEEALHAVIDAMQSLPAGFSVPLEVKLKAGKTWAECKPCDRLLAGTVCPS